MRLQCAQVYGSEAWRQVLLQCGVPMTVGHGAGIGASHASVLIVDGRLSKEDGEEVHEYLLRGGAVIGSASDLAPAIGMTVRRAYVRYLIDDRDVRWCDLLDLETHCDIPREANILRTEQGVASVFAGAIGGGWAVLLPFDLQHVWEQYARSYRQFPSRYDRLPFELVSSVPRADLTMLVGKALEFLHHRQGLPYARLWPFPGGAPSVFGVRLDTDKANRTEIDDYVNCSRTTGVPFTWFVDTGSHAGFLDCFVAMGDQEIGVHCQRHVVYRSVDDFRTDIRLARTRLQRIGLQPTAYAAPFGEWSTELGEAIDDSQLAYSSEFTLGYDGLPFVYRTRFKGYLTPQIPVHPVSTGALRRAGYTRDRMVSYYSSVLRRKLARQEPCLLFDHPVHRNHEVVKNVVINARAHGVLPMRLGDYARWWQTRNAVLDALSLDWDHGTLTSSCPDPGVIDPSVFLRVTTPTGSSLQPIGSRFTVGNLGERQQVDDAFSLDDIRRSREFDLRTAFGIATMMLQRRLRQ